MWLSLNILGLDFLAALSPQDRWNAARRLGLDFGANDWFMAVGFVSLVTLAVLLFLVTWRRMAAERRLAEQLFLGYADRRGLSPNERDMLRRTAALARLRHISAIFTMEGAFQRGVERLLQKSLPRHGAEQNETLRKELLALSEKLGFKKDALLSIGSVRSRRGLTSRNIPVGRTVHLTRRKERDSGDIESTVVENTDMELKVRTPVLVRVNLGEPWRVQYYFGSSIWEFDTTVVSCEGDLLVLNHSDSVRFINRRRFLRVPVNKPALVAVFPFEKPVLQPLDDSGNCCRPPEFVPALVTELAGPGLRVEASMELAVGDRVLVVFRLSGDEAEPSSGTGEQHGKPPELKVVQDIGEVRHVEKAQNGFSAAVELTGLSDSDLNEMIRATNLASLETGPAEALSSAVPQQAVVAEGT